MHRTLRFGADAVIGLGLIGLGLILVAGQWLGVNILNLFWPLLIIIPGLLCFAAMVAGGKSAAWLAFPGTIVTTVGFLLLYQNWTGHYASWAYAWTLIFPTGVGVALVIAGLWSGKKRDVERGKKMTRAGLIIYVVGAVFFELILNISGSWANRILLPLGLIALGLYLLIFRAGLISLRSLLGEEDEPR